MNNVKLLRQFSYSPDGITIVTLKKGAQESVADDILQIMIELGVCELLETRAHSGPPENKAQPRKRGRPRKGSTK